MKFKLFSLRVQSSLLFLFISSLLPSIACGPYYDCIPTPCFFTSVPQFTVNLERQENLRLWQELTSKNISFDDIEQAVYQDSWSTTLQASWHSSTSSNAFYRYLRHNDEQAIFSFLLLAKELQELREQMNSPWYYPASREQASADPFEPILQQCNKNLDPRLKDRYALQAVRALFASRQYAECITYFNEHLQSFPESNLFKRMAQRYVAGCWSRLGDIDKANTYFAQADDLSSIVADDPLTYLATHHPDSPAVLAYLQAIATDSAAICRTKPLAIQILNGKKSHNKGDWAFLLAYIAQEFHHQPTEAQRYLNLALRSTFSSEDLHDHARAYRMLLRADRGDRRQLLSDLRWMESKSDPRLPHANEWNRLLQHIVFAHWLPVLMQQKDYTTAILLTGYAENRPLHQPKTGPQVQNWTEARLQPIFHNIYDYGSLTFQLMGSLTSEQLSTVEANLHIPHPLWDFLKSYARTDADYFNELIGTLALREENYARAIRYLSQVSPTYQTCLNIYKDGYLNRNPFVNYPTRWQKSMGNSREYEYEYPQKGYAPPLASGWNAKLRFAQQMWALQQIKNNESNPDLRALAEVKYAMGVRNSFEECWALTQYWRGWCPSRFYPTLDPIQGSDTYSPLNFLYHYDQHRQVEKRYQQCIEQALQQLTTDEARAEAQWLLNHPATVIRKYGHTTVATRIKQSCDHWHNWL